MRYNTPAVHALLMAAFLCTAPVAEAAMYKWVDETGSVTYSNAPPVDPDKAREVTAIEDIRADSGKPDAGLEATRRNADDSTAASSPVDAPDTPEAGATAAPPRISARRRRTEAVQDPCLRSPDPQCYQKNKENYDPYLGYAPSTLAPSAGATSGAAAGGAVSNH